MAKRVLTIIEHQSLPFAWDDNHLRSLTRINRAAGAEVLQATSSGGRRVLKAGCHVGMVRLGHHTIQILPKLDYGPDTALSATRNLLTMLEMAGNFPVRQHDIAPFLQRGRDWFEILTYLFARELLAQWQHGAHHQYRVVEQTAVALKGKWRLSEQVRHPARQHLFDVAYDEFTADNALNRVLRYVVELLWQQTGDSDNRRLLGTLRHWLADITLPARVGPEAARPELITRLNRRYEPLLNLARLFLQTGTLEMSAGHLASFAFVFDMNQLFEAFIINLIRQQPGILPPWLQDCTLHPQTRGHTRFLAQTAEGTAVFRMKPDLALRQGANYPLLVDTKYKLLHGEDARLGIAPSDFYQMFAYSRRYNCPHVLLLYPQGEQPLRQRFALPDGAGTISAATVDLRRDLRGRHGRLALLAELREIMTSEVKNGPTP
jgi:5-methylcytosine-specific restriction enzyme subunit McrC